MEEAGSREEEENVKQQMEQLPEVKVGEVKMYYILFLQDNSLAVRWQMSFTENKVGAQCHFMIPLTLAVTQRK